MIAAISMGMISIGILFFLGEAIGLIRFPDFYSRVHAAGKGDTLSVLLVLGGMALYNLETFTLASVLVSLKILLVCAFIFITSPTTTHALMNAGYESKDVEPWTKEQNRPGGES